jgi:hypothetical protein
MPSKMNYTIQRVDEEDGTIVYECYSSHPYYRVFAISTFESDYAKRDADRICRLLNFSD